MTRGKPPEREAKLIAAIRAAGTIRTKELSEATGVQPSNIGTGLAQAIARGTVYVCKVAPGPGGTGRPTNEYRIGGGMPAPDFTPLDPKRARIAAMASITRRAPDTRAATGTLPARSVMPEVPVFLSSTTPQPAVGNTGSTQSELTSADERAVTSIPETPGPQPERRGMGPAPARAPVGNAEKLKLAIDADGVLQMGDDTDPARFVFTPQQTKQLGYFLRQTHDVWNPF
jgi:hypothetical protein